MPGLYSKNNLLKRGLDTPFGRKVLGANPNLGSALGYRYDDEDLDEFGLVSHSHSNLGQ